MKVGFHNYIYKSMKGCVSIWWLLTPNIQKLWNGKIIYIGLRGWFMSFDFRGMNNINDFIDLLLNKKP